MIGRPHVVVLAGANGAGKSTTAPVLLRGKLGVAEFVNADTIARGLSAFAPERAAIDAGRVMLRRLEQLAAQRHDFAFETTLASRTFAPRIARWMEAGYAFHLVFLWLPNAEFALARIRERVQLGGHDVPEDTVRRRYRRGLENFFALYQPLATTWRFYDNAHAQPRLVARGDRTGRIVVLDGTLWPRIREE
jgi:predicted ABC-type ATPase